MRYIDVQENKNSSSPLGQGVCHEKMPGHWLLASLGKQVLRPGGLELTRAMLEQLCIGPGDWVVEFAPGLGVTAKLVLDKKPSSYVAVERDENVARHLARRLNGQSRCLIGNAEDTRLPEEAFTVVYGEAMLSMQSLPAKLRIVKEAARLLRKGGRYGIHELCLVPDDIGETVRREIAAQLSTHIHVGVQPVTAAEWRSLLECAGFAVRWERRAPMRLLEPGRLVRDEGLAGAIRFSLNLLRMPAARKRVIQMRRLFLTYRHHLEAVAFLCTKA